MYDVGTSVLYSRIGVCVVADIGPTPLRRGDQRLYYRLRSLFSSADETAYIPVDAAGDLRPLAGSGEAAECWTMLRDLRPQTCGSRKIPELILHYQERLSSGRLRDCLGLIKEIRLKERELACRGKKLGQVDLKYLKIAEKLVCEELAAVEHTAPESIRTRLYAELEIPSAQQDRPCP